MEALAVVAVVVALVAVVVALRSRSLSRAGQRTSERRAAEAERDRGEVEGELRSMELVLSSMQEGVLLLTRDGRTAFANPALADLLGALPASRDALLPLGLRHAAERAAVERTATTAEVEIDTPPRWLRGTATPVGDDGTVLLVLRDVTEPRRLDEVRRDFVANASHELKTPVASIQAAAETIGTAALDDPGVIPRFAGQLQREAGRLSRIVSDLLDLSRLEAGSERQDRVALEAVIRDELERFRGPAAEVGVTLEVDTPSVPPVRGSARDLALLVRNLVDNAVRYTPPGGGVIIRLRAEDASIVLTVADTGVGIPSRDLGRVFERFYRVDRARSRETGGTGLGLSIVRHVAENHGGTVTVRSELGRGSTFDVRLPVGTG